MNKVIITTIFFYMLCLVDIFAIVPPYPEILRQKDWKKETSASNF